MARYDKKAQAKYNERWRKRNPQRARYLSARTVARSFVRKYATREDMGELVNIFEQENESYGEQ